MSWRLMERDEAVKSQPYVVFEDNETGTSVTADKPIMQQCLEGAAWHGDHRGLGIPEYLKNKRNWSTLSDISC
jgi:hypothetical protein